MEIKKVNKAVILMAGKGTRALPATKAVAKELFPIGNTPALLFLLEECLESGIKQVIIVISKQKKDVIRFLRHDKDLEKLIAGTDKEKLLTRWRNVVDNLDIKFVYQGKMNGSGGAVMSAQKYVKNEAFLLMTADDVCINESEQKPASAQLIECYEQYGKYVVGSLYVSDDKISSYGIIKPGKTVAKKVVEVKGFVEKPKLENKPSNLASVARYVVLPSIFANILKCEKHQNGEVFFPEAIAMEIQNKNVLSLEFDAKYYDLGNNLEYMKCVIETSLKDETIKQNLKEYLNNLVKTL